MKEFARQRLQKASETAEAARLLAGEDYRDAAADRAYYAMFYAVEALLSEQHLTFSRHGAVHGAFGRLFAKTGELDPKYHRWLIQAFEARQTATYGADFDDEASQESVGSRIAQAEELIEAVREYLARER